MSTYPSLKPAEATDKSQLLSCCERVLNIGERYGDRQTFIQNLEARFDHTYSVKLCLHDQIIGGYLLSPHHTIYESFNLTHQKVRDLKANLHRYSTKQANRVRHLLKMLSVYQGPSIQGQALFLEKKYRKRGWGKLMIEYPYSLYPQFQYIWGGQEQDLYNLYDWLKRRDLLFYDGSCFYTIGSLAQTNPPSDQNIGP